MSLSGRRLRTLRSDEHGQVLPLVALFMTLLLGLTALSIDFGRAFLVSRSLQAATDAEALAGAQSMTLANAPSTVYAAALNYSATTGKFNASSLLSGVTASSPVLKCLQTLVNQNQYCVGPVPYNALQVTQSIVIPMYFAGVFNVKTLTINATSTAAAHGGVPRYANIAMIMDTTLSMGEIDTNCSSQTQMNCALQGISVLLANIVPCPVIQGNCTTTSTPGQVQGSVQRASMFAFPNISVNTASIDTNCTTSVPTPTYQNGYWGPYAASGGQSFYVGNFVMPVNTTGTATVAPYSGIPTAVPYSFPAANGGSYSPSSASGTPTYQITGYLSDYRQSALATSLNVNSDIVQASAGLNGCGAMQPPNYTGQFGTYYAGAIYAAQDSLVNQQALHPGSTNVIILLSDGDSNAPQYWGSTNDMPGASGTGVYPSYVGQCGQAVDAAANATAAGTEVYSVAYGSPQTGCSTDLAFGSHPLITPCQTMAAIATSSHYFYSDFNQSGSYSTCTTSYPSVTLSDIFRTIAVDLTVPRLIPNNWT